MAEDSTIVSEVNQRKMPLDISQVLDMACGNPENWKAYQNWQRKHSQWVNAGSQYGYPEPIYFGVMQFSIKLHCNEIIVRARRTPNNDGWNIMGYLVRDH